MTADISERRRSVDPRLGLQLRAQSAVTWTLARLGDPLARLLHAPWQTDPYPIYEQLRARGPLIRSRLGPWVVPAHELCAEILRDRRFGFRDTEDVYANPGAEAAGLSMSLLALDPPDHTRIRRIAAPSFRPRRLEEFRGRIEASTEALLDAALADGGEFDLMRDFASPVPIRVISDLLGLPEVGAEWLAHHGGVVAGALDAMKSGKHARQMNASAAELDAMFGALITERRAEPADDMISELIAAADDGDLTGTELVDLCNLLLIAGFETTVKLIGNAVNALLDHPDQLELVQKDPDLVPAVVEETLRWNPPVHVTMRVSHEAVRVADRELPPNSVMFMLIGSAGRDETVHVDADRFDITRGERQDHLAFSGGVHYCLGAVLSRMEAEIALRCLITRVPELSRAGAAVRQPTTVIQGLSSLPVKAG